MATQKQLDIQVQLQDTWVALEQEKMLAQRSRSHLYKDILVQCKAISGEWLQFCGTATSCHDGFMMAYDVCVRHNTTVLDWTVFDMYM